MDRYKALEKEFKDYSQKVLKEQAEKIQKKYKTMDVVSKPLRLKTFNEHLDILKTLLHKGTNDILLPLEDEGGKEKAQLEQKLKQHCETCIQHFLKKDFDIEV